MKNVGLFEDKDKLWLFAIIQNTNKNKAKEKIPLDGLDTGWGIGYRALPANPPLTWLLAG